LNLLAWSTRFVTFYNVGRMIHAKGHDPVFATFAKAEANSRLGHAYLFVGQNGIGKRTLALNITRILLCENRPATGFRECGHCASCAMVEANSHPDVILASRPEDLIEFPVDSIRDVIAQLSLKPNRGKRKIAIVDHADDFNEESSNAFLKTLEEPPPSSMLILIGGPGTERQLQTILSRCQVVRFASLDSQLLGEMLTEQGITDPSRRAKIISLSQGSIGQALELSDERLWTFRADLLSFLGQLPVDSVALCKRWIEFLDSTTKDASAGVRRRRAALTLRLMLGLFQESLYLGYGSSVQVVDPSEKEILIRYFEKIGPDTICEQMERTIQTITQIQQLLMTESVFEAYCDSFVRFTGVR